MSGPIANLAVPQPSPSADQAYVDRVTKALAEAVGDKLGELGARLDGQRDAAQTMAVDLNAALKRIADLEEQATRP